MENNLVNSSITPRKLLVSCCYLLLALNIDHSGAEQRADTPPFHYRQAAFQPWSNTDLKRAESLFAELFSGMPPGQQIPDWQALGMTIATHTLPDGETVYLLSPQSGARQGAGYYLLRTGQLTGTVTDIILQAPHQFHDRHTGHIALQLFSEYPASALALNSAHRKRVANKASLSTNPDLAHNANTLLMAFTRGFIASQAEGRVIQIHGFSASKRRTAAGRRAQVIVSGGVNWPTALSTEVANCLAKGQSDVLLYPRDVDELGGTTNSIANWLAMTGKGHFLHLENNSIIRENLLNNLRVRSLFWSCISTGIGNVQAGNAKVEKIDNGRAPVTPDSAS